MAAKDNANASLASNKDEGSKEKDFFNRSRAGGKSIWDWMQLLIIPFILVIVGSFFSYQQTQTSLEVSQRQHDADQQNTLEQQRAAILQTYMDNIQDLLLNHNLLGSKRTDDVAILARARTLTALQGLDPDRKSRLLVFLHEAQLITFVSSNGKTRDAIIDLTDADLNGVNLNGVNLNRIDLKNVYLNSATIEEANLNGADLTDASLGYTNLAGTSLVGASLVGTDLGQADLNNTDLTDADLSGAYLDKVDLAGAKLVGAKLVGTYLNDISYLGQDQLDQVSSCKNTTLPPGLTCHHNQ